MKYKMTKANNDNKIVNYFEPYLKEVVTIHYAMFNKMLLSKKYKEGKIPIESAEPFEDAANNYMEFSERISEQYI